MVHWGTDLADATEEHLAGLARAAVPQAVSGLGGGELLLPGEIRLAPGETYRGPWLYGAYGHGLDELSARFHRFLRDRPEHPRSPRPVLVNTWEAVYFNHDLGKLTALADVAAQVGVESCASGGARVDLGVLERTERIWASDCNDALERQLIQRWTGILVPPEMIGAHIGPTIAHTTERAHTLDFRAGTALFGHLGIEWDLTEATAAERERVAAWVRLYKQLRGLLHSGTVLRVDHPDPALLVHGVVARDRSEAVYAVVALATGLWSPPGRIPLPGLDPDAEYRIGPLPPGHQARGPTADPLPWWGRGVDLSGRMLTAVGVQAPALFPERLVLIRAVRQ